MPDSSMFLVCLPSIQKCVYCKTSLLASSDMGAAGRSRELSCSRHCYRTWSSAHSHTWCPGRANSPRCSRTGCPYTWPTLVDRWTQAMPGALRSTVALCHAICKCDSGAAEGAVGPIGRILVAAVDPLARPIKVSPTRPPSSDSFRCPGCQGSRHSPYWPGHS